MPGKRSYSVANRPRRTTQASGARGDYDTTRWKRESARFLELRPLCACGCGQPSAHVDHIQPAKEHPHLFWARSNWQALSDRCHRIKSRIEQGARGELGRVTRKSARVKGCDPATGRPLDKDHWWNRDHD